VALYAGGWAISQLWLFWVAPLVGGVLGAVVHRFLAGSRDA
jgi:aquaporin Z